MSRYPWARSFIRQARWFSVLLVICGLAFVGFEDWNLHNQVHEAAYRPNPQVEESLQALRGSLQQSLDVVSKFQKSTGGEPLPTSLNIDLTVLPGYGSPADLASAGDQITTAKSAVAELKKFLVASLQQNLADLVHQLREHAASLAASDQNPAAASPAPAPAPPSPEPAAGLRGLFTNEVTVDVAQQKKTELQQTEDLLKKISERTEKPENQVKLQSSVSEIHRLEGLLAYLTGPADFPAATNAAPGADAATPAATPADSGAAASGTNSAPPSAPPGLEASKVADLLETAQGTIQDAITSNWLVDQRISEAEPLVLQEQKLADQAVDETTKRYIEFYENAVIIVMLTGLLAYFVQIIADVVQAHIDNADNSFEPHPPPPGA